MDEPGLQRIAVSQLQPDEGQPRHAEGDRRALEALKASMQQLGRTVQYVTVSPLPDGSYRIVSGHRRVQAARELEWDWLPAIVVDDVADDVDRRLRQIAENSARAALRPIELCEAIEELRDRVEPPAIAGATGVSLRTVYNYLAILEHPDLVDQLREGRALRSVLAEAAARRKSGPLIGTPPDGPAPGPQARQAAKRKAQRSLERLREAWTVLDDDLRRVLAEQLRDLLGAVDSAPPSPLDTDPGDTSATLH